MKALKTLLAAVSLVALLPVCSPAQTVEWSRHADFGNKTGGSAPVAVTLDPAGNVYVTGDTEPDPLLPGTVTSYATIKYTPDGKVVWMQQYHGAGTGNDSATAVAADSQGNAYVTGYSNGAGTRLDYATIKYDANGHVVWVRRYNGPGNGDDGANAIALDPEGNVLVTGYSTGVTTRYDFATVKYSPDGKQLWVRRYDSVTHWKDKAIAVATDAARNVYVTGQGFDLNYKGCYTTIKYSPEGKTLWIRRRSGYYGGGFLDSSPTAMTLDAAANVYVTGYAPFYPGLLTSYLTIKYDTHGKEQWARRYWTGGDDFPAAVAVNATGDVYVTGHADRTTDGDFATVKYDSAGVTKWVRYYTRYGHGGDSATCMALDPDGNIVVGGWSIGASTLLKYDPDGNRLWVRHNPLGWFSAVATDAAGDIYAVEGYYGFYTQKYSP